jgi:hypothetical protein
MFFLFQIEKNLIKIHNNLFSPLINLGLTDI